jgi:hypothetical protein
VTAEEDLLPLPDDDFRRIRRYLAPHVYATWRVDDPDEPDLWAPPDDMIPKDDWDGIMTLPTDVVLKTTSYEGSLTHRLHQIASDWVWATPMEPDTAPFMHEPAIIAGEELDAAVFNAVHGYYRQAFSCMRNVLEVMAIAAGLAAARMKDEFAEWRNGKEIFIGRARRFLENSSDGRRIDKSVTTPIFGEDEEPTGLTASTASSVTTPTAILATPMRTCG